MTLVLRLATREDAAAIALVRVHSWRAAYAGLISQDFLDRMDVEREGQRRVELWDEYHSDPRGAELVAEMDGEIAGWAAMGVSLDEDLADSGQIYALYALPRFWSTGVGHALITRSESLLAEAGFRSAHLWVLEGNDRAASFYERHGWLEDGATQEDDRLIGGRFAQTLRERRRVRPLSTVARDADRE